MVCQQLVVVHAGSYELCMVDLPVLGDVQGVKQLLGNLPPRRGLLVTLLHTACILLTAAASSTECTV